MPFQYGHKVRVGRHCRRWPTHLEFGGLWEWRRVPRDRSHQGRAGGSSPFVGPQDFVTGLWWYHSPGASGGIPGHCGRWPPAQQNRECCARRRGRVRALTSSASIGRAVWYLAGAAAAVAVPTASASPAMTVAVIAGGATNGYKTVTCAGTPHAAARSSRSRVTADSPLSFWYRNQDSTQRRHGRNQHRVHSPSSPGTTAIIVRICRCDTRSHYASELADWRPMMSVA